MATRKRFLWYPIRRGKTRGQTGPPDTYSFMRPEVWGKKVAQNATFNLFFLGLDWPWVGEFVGFILIFTCFPTQQHLVNRKHSIHAQSSTTLAENIITIWFSHYRPKWCYITGRSGKKQIGAHLRSTWYVAPGAKQGFSRTNLYMPVPERVLNKLEKKKRFHHTLLRTFLMQHA